MMASGSAPLGAVGMGLTAATLWGGSDFAGGLGARRAPALMVVGSGHLVTFLLLIAVCAGVSLPAQRFVLLGLAAGVEGALALAVFYRALAMGAMGATAAVTGVLTAAVPVGFALVAGRRTTQARRRTLALGAAAGVGFGVQLVLLKLAAGGGVVWAMTTARAGGLAGVAMVLLLRRGVRLPRSGYWRMGVAAGLMDALGNGAYMVAAGAGRMEVGAMIASMYPVVTMGLAAVVLREPTSRRQKAGMALAAAAVVLLSG